MGFARALNGVPLCGPRRREGATLHVDEEVPLWPIDHKVKRFHCRRGALLAAGEAFVIGGEAFLIVGEAPGGHVRFTLIKAARVARFLSAYPQTIAPLGRHADYVDLRYANGFAVRVPELASTTPKRPGA